MTEIGTSNPSDRLEKLMSKHDHVREYVNEFYDEYAEYPLVVDHEDVGDYEVRYPNVLYQASDIVFIHVFADRGIEIRYYAIEPELTDDDRRKMDTVKELIIEEAGHIPSPTDDTEQNIRDYIDTLLDNVIVPVSEKTLLDRFLTMVGQKMELNDKQFDRIRYHLQRDITGLGPLDPTMLDTHNEDIHIIGHDECFVDHGVFDLIETDISFENENVFDDFLKNLGERMNSPISDSDPIVDSTLPTGDRVNIVYSTDVSIRGSSMTIRQGEEVPLSILQITKWGTLSPMMAAYFWLCLENEQSIFVVGETASGKTTTLNSLLSFIDNDSKIYTAEDTAEVMPPQSAWQQLLTRETPNESATDVDMFDLVSTALRSRPDYIVVGEVRGEEAQMAFQAAQTGHPVLLTFHASDIKSMIERFTSEPINVPESFMDNCDVALFQNRVKRDDGEILRRVTEVVEITGYSKEQQGIITKKVFEWDSADDVHMFTGMNNSYVLEEQVAELLGYEDTSDIYNELNRRRDIIERLIESDILEYHEVNNAIDTIQTDGVGALSIDTSGLTR